MDGDTAGDPGGALKWTRRTTAKLARQPRESGIRVGTRTVARLLRSMGYSLRVNHKKLAAANHPQRDAQFARITVLRRRGASENIPIISIDTKKKGKRLFLPLLSVFCGVHHLLGRHLFSGRLSCLGLAMVLLFTLRCIRLTSAAGSRR